MPPDLPPNFTRLKAREGTNMVTEDVSSSEIRRRMNIGKHGLTGLAQGNYQMVMPPTSPPPPPLTPKAITPFLAARRAICLTGWHCAILQVDGLLSPPVLAHIIRYKLYITR